jgi:hypothetical protein
MTEPVYTVKEIMELQFKGIDAKLDDIKNTLKEQNLQSEKRFIQLESEVSLVQKEVQNLKEENARYKTIWGIGATVGASLVAFILNRIF